MSHFVGWDLVEKSGRNVIYNVSAGGLETAPVMVLWVHGAGLMGVAKTRSPKSSALIHSFHSGIRTQNPMSVVNTLPRTTSAH